MAGTYRQAGLGLSTRARRGRRRVLRSSAALSGVAAAAALVAACGSSSGPAGGSGSNGTGASGGTSSAAQAAASGAVVSARQVSGVGNILVNKSGMTLYAIKTPSEANGKIICTGTCTSFWMPLTASSASLSSSGLPGKLGTVRRPGGTTQVTYNRLPLYTFKLDTAPGQAKGNGYTDQFSGPKLTWEAVTASGAPAGTGTGTSGSGSSGSGSGGSGSSGSGSGGYGY
jgi:predicted lipoprotein with Yx(FWY)xxD motif